MTAKRPKKLIPHPTPAEKRACVEVAALAVEWCEHTGLANLPTSSVAIAIDTVRSFVNGMALRPRVDGALNGLCAYNVRTMYPSLDSARDAVLYAAGLCIAPSVDEKTFAAARVVLMDHVVACGRSLGVSRPDDDANLAWADALAEHKTARGTMPVANSPDHAKLITRGYVLRILRGERPVANVAFAAGLTAAQVTRAESGSAAPAVACSEELARALGRDGYWVNDRTDTAYAAAAQWLGRAAGVTGDRWYADTVAIEHGRDDVARSFLNACAAMAVWSFGSE